MIALVAGLAAFVLIFALLSERDQTFPVAVTATDLRPGDPVAAEAFRVTQVDADPALVASLVDPDTLARAAAEGWVVTRALAAGELVRRIDLQTATSGIGLRAMSIPIESGHDVAGALRPGDRADVIVTRDGVASYVVADAEVLDTSLSTAAVGGGVTITVAVDGPTTLRLAAALRDGEVDVARATGAPPVAPDATYSPGPASPPGTGGGEGS